MASLNPFEGAATEDDGPFLPASYSDRSSPPRSIEMFPMTANPVTGDSYVTGIYPSLSIPGGTPEPSAPLLPLSHPPPHQPRFHPTRSGASGGCHSLPRTHASPKSEREAQPRVNGPKLDGDLLHILSDAAPSNYTKSVRTKQYTIKNDQAKDELSRYFDDLHRKLKKQHEKLLEGLERKYRQNVGVIEKNEKEIENLENKEPLLFESTGESFEKLRTFLSEQKRELEAAITPLMEIKLSYKPELLEGVINDIVTVSLSPDSASPTGPRPRGKSQDGSWPAEDKQERETRAPDSQLYMKLSNLDTANSSSRPGPITQNIGMGALFNQVQDPAGIVIDKHQDNVIYVADKEKHRVQVYDRSGRHLRTISKGDKMRYPHSLAVSNDFLFVLCAGRPEEKQCVLRFDKVTGAFRNGLWLKDIRHTPISVYQENVYIPTYTGVIEVFSVKLERCKKIEISLEKKNGSSIFSSGPEIRDICVNSMGIYLLVSNSENWVQVFNPEGKLTNTLAPLGCLNDAHHFTVDNRGHVLVTEGKDGKIKIFKPGDKTISARGDAEMGGEMERISSPRGIAVDSHGKVVLCCAQNDWLLKEC